jgi:hypothetical protein
MQRLFFYIVPYTYAAIILYRLMSYGRDVHVSSTAGSVVRNGKECCPQSCIMVKYSLSAIPETFFNSNVNFQIRKRDGTQL